MLDNSKQDNLLNQYKLGVPPGIIITNLNITTNSTIFYNIKRDLISDGIWVVKSCPGLIFCPIFFRSPFFKFLFIAHL